MSTFKSDFLNVLSSRGFVHQISEPDALDQLAQRPGLTAYIGFDCTASSLHVGSLIQIMMLYWLQQTGGRPIALMGGGTTRVGDPSGKDESRRLLTDADIAKNLDGIRAVFTKFLRFGDGPGDARMANNADWLNTLNYIDFLRDVGRHFSVNRMLAFDSVKLRLDRQQELSFLEFNYMILQAYDFVELYKRERCVLQMGGSDQWGNIVSGIDLGRRMANAQLFALTTPLLTTSSGAKMGKTAAGAVWLNADMVSPYDYWQFWRNTEDADVTRFLKLFTVLPLPEIERLAALQGAEINEAKKVLATEATALVHGREAADAAAATARQTFEEGTLAESLPTVEITRWELKQGIGVLTAFAEKTHLVTSNGEARRQIKAGGLKVNDRTVTDEKAMLKASDLTPEGVIKLSLGKKRHVLLKLVAGKITKLEAGGRQLDAAIRMFFDDEDFLAIHTVSRAAFRILFDLTSEGETKAALDAHIQKIGIDRFNRITNFLKHADEDPDDEVDEDFYISTEAGLGMASSLYVYHAKKLTPEIKAFGIWSRLMRPQYFPLSEEVAKDIANFRAENPVNPDDIGSQAASRALGKTMLVYFRTRTR